MVSCLRCGARFERRVHNQRFCSAACRSAAASARARGASAVDEGQGSVYAATEVELDRAGVTGSALGQMALRLARRLDAGGESGSQAAAVNRELRATLEQATKGAAGAADPVDELSKRRGRRVARGG